MEMEHMGRLGKGFQIFFAFPGGDIYPDLIPESQIFDFPDIEVNFLFKDILVYRGAKVWIDNTDKIIFISFLILPSTSGKP